MGGPQGWLPRETARPRGRGPTEAAALAVGCRVPGPQPAVPAPTGGTGPRPQHERRHPRRARPALNVNWKQPVHTSPHGGARTEPAHCTDAATEAQRPALLSPTRRPATSPERLLESPLCFPAATALCVQPRLPLSSYQLLASRRLRGAFKLPAGGRRGGRCGD